MLALYKLDWYDLEYFTLNLQQTLALTSLHPISLPVFVLVVAPVCQSQSISRTRNFGFYKVCTELLELVNKSYKK